MDAVASLNATAIPIVLQPTMNAFVKLLEKKRADIESITSKTFRYGDTERHNLDVYYPPPEATSGGPTPVLFFVYGGGFTSGTRRFDPPFDLVYTNLGAFFAKRGILTVIPDYRLVPEAKFPDPLEDVRDALAWFLANTGPVSASSPPDLSLSLENPAIFVMGHSAGATIVSSLYLLPSVLPLDSPVRAATRGLVPQGGAYKFDFARPTLAPGVLEQLYGSQESTLELMPVSLVARAKEEVVRSLPEVFALVSELDPAQIKEGGDEFVKALEGRVGKAVRYEVMKGHNHISPHWALLSGEGEEWGVQVADWIKSKV
ncbi:alpha/beta hydrolase domain-containing protein [Trametes coccinea BRFM310]|uniref:Alpha/beta hydrolase domain-containing protein n=1 Tax=Trametes coccinea (strain BRFM310) TaxID=1353009 RepID=A0A1Y2IC08_TRAC3|nr:alpha/beta hydrolase domain-containing protein [Trametes coccinea BRFM310]